MFEDGMIDSCTVYAVVRSSGDFGEITEKLTIRVSGYKCRFTGIPNPVSARDSVPAGYDPDDLRWVSGKNDSTIVIGDFIDDGSTYWQVLSIDKKRNIKSTTPHHLRMLVAKVNHSSAERTKYTII